MSESFGPQKNRRTVVEARPAKGAMNNTKRRRAKNGTHPRNSSLEAQPVIKAAQEYARRTHSIGALQGAVEIQRLVEKINDLGINDKRLEEILTEGKVSAEHLRSYVHKVYAD